MMINKIYVIQNVEIILKQEKNNVMMVMIFFMMDVINVNINVNNYVRFVNKVNV